MIFADGHGIGEALASLLRNDGCQCLIVTPGETFEVLDNGHLRVTPTGPADFRHLVEHVRGTSRQRWHGVVHLWSLDAPPPEALTAVDLERAYVLGCGSVMHLVQSMARFEDHGAPRLWLVTRGAQPVVADDAVAVAQAPLWGFGRTLAYEHARLWGGLVDLDARSSARDAAAALAQAIRAAGEEDQIAARGGRHYVARLVRKVVGAPARPLPLRADATYLITGGLGDLGLVAARWLAHRGARDVTLLSRTPLPPRSTWNELEEGGRSFRQAAAIRDIERSGTTVRLVSADVADEAQMQAFLATHAREGRPPIRGVMHTAAVLEGSIILKLDDRALTTAMRPKAMGAWLLDRLFESSELDFFVLFSAIPSLLGWLGQGAANYAAANAFLDALAHHRRRRGRPALSIIWGPWRHVGMVARTGGGLERLASQGIGSLSPNQGQQTLERLLPQDLTQVAVLALNWPRLLEAAPGVAASPLVAHVVRQREPDAARAAAAAEEPLLRANLLAANGAERVRLLESYVCRNLATVLQIAPSRLDTDRPLSQQGLDSLMAIELRNRVERDFGTRISMMALLEGASIRELVAMLAGQLLESPAAAAHSPVPAAQDIDPGEAERLLADLDLLSDARVDSLLERLLEGRHVD